ncbi:MAG: glycosyltransferase family 2 protein [Actinomycetota bacterium]
MMTGRNVVPWPSVSVVIVTQVRDAFLRRAIRSVVSQRYPGRIECVVVFDRCLAFDLSDVAPADGGDRTLRVIENRGTPGLAGARNEGAVRAFGDVLSFCRAGDEWLPGKVAHQIAALEATGADVAATGIERPARGRALARGPASDRVSPTALLRRRATEMHPSTIAVRREAFHTTIGPFDEAIPGSYGDEYDWLLRAVAVADLVAVREPLVRVDRGDDPFLGARWRTIAAAIADLTTVVPEPLGRNVAAPYGRVAGPRRGPQRSERRRERGTGHATRRALWRSASRSAT